MHIQTRVKCRILSSLKERIVRECKTHVKIRLLQEILKTKTVLFEYLSHPYKIIHYDWVFLHTIYHISFLLVGVCATFTWSRRMKIALDAAKGLAFLHGAERPIIYRDFKTSNILLDAVSFHTMLYLFLFQSVFIQSCTCYKYPVFNIGSLSE